MQFFAYKSGQTRFAKWDAFHTCKFNGRSSPWNNLSLEKMRRN